MDMEFEKIKDDMQLVDINTTAAQEHVREIERSIHLLKECACPRPFGRHGAVCFGVRGK